MGKVLKILSVISILAIAFGTIMVFIGLRLGGNLSYSLINGKRVDSDRALVSNSVSLNEFDKIEIQNGAFEIYVVQGDEYRVDYTAFEGYEPKIEQNGNKLMVSSLENDKIEFQFVNSTDEFQEKITITVPMSDKTYYVDVNNASGLCDFDSINIEGSILCTSGEIEISNSVVEGDLDIDVTSGEIYLDNCSYNNMDIDATSGDVGLESCVIDSMFASLKSGSFTSNNLLVNNLNCDATSGSFDMGIVGDVSEYSLDLARTSGEIVINETEYDYVKSNEKKDKSISVKVLSGEFVAIIQN